MKSLLYANCTDSIGVSHDEDISFNVEGVPFHWVASRSRYEATPMKAIPQTVTFDTVTTFHDAADSGATGVVNTAAVVTWTNSRIDTIVTPAVAGNLPGALWAMTAYEVGATLLYTFIAFALSVATWNHSGPEPVLVLWLLMWGSWVAVVQGTAAEIGIVLLVLGGGTLTAKIYLDRRSLG
jgi:hypothetical protein